jgi:AraC family transcriptional regulator
VEPVQKALWFVESHFHDPISLDEIAIASRVSAYHLTRAFAASTGLSLMRYVRARRLTEAAKQLAAGADDILRVALDTGYNSHESFSRAFKDRFTLTPEQVRSQGHLNNLILTEAIAMNATSTITEISQPRIELLQSMSLAGIVERHQCDSPAGIPNQWQRFSPFLGNIPKQFGNVAYGVCFNFDSDTNFDYMCGVEVKGSAELPFGLVRMDVPAQKCAVFVHSGHIASIRATLSAIWSKALPESGCEPTNGPTIERYGPEFNPATGLGGVEIWIPVK